MYRLALNYVAMKTIMDIRAKSNQLDTGQSGGNYRTCERPEVSRQYIGSPRGHYCCNFSKNMIAKFIAVSDAVKGTLGIVFGIYMSIYLFQLPQLNYDAYSNDVNNCEEPYELNDYHQSELSYILAYGVTTWGVIISLFTLIVWNLLLIVFGKILWAAARDRNTKRLRFWYAYTFFSTLIFVGLYIWFIISFPNYRKSRLWQDESVEYFMWLSITWYYFLSFFTAIFCLVTIQSLVKEIDLGHQIQQQCRGNQVDDV